MKVSEILKAQLEKIKLGEKELIKLEKEAEKFEKNLNEKLRIRKIRADVFLGGSLAKKTILRKNKYDIDVFVRFDKKYKDEEISLLLEKVVEGRKIHGSRDYFSVTRGKINFEVIPVVKISKPKEARNVTDLSYFHVKYVAEKIKKKPKLTDEIMLAKDFSYTNRCYGAESYIKGFSGYALELLIIHYNSFMNFVKHTANSKTPIIIDKSKFYKSRQKVLEEMNEAKLKSPIIFVDPTFKERNVLAALSWETFSKFKTACQKFLKKPSKKFFQEKKVNRKNFNLILKAKTNKQEGDIAGSKLLKFYNFFAAELEKNFKLEKKDFDYNNRKEATSYFKIKPKKELIVSGPPITALENVLKFKKRHEKVFVKKGKVYAREKTLKIKEFLGKFRKENKGRMKEMGILWLRFD